MQTVRPATPFHNTSGLLIDDLHLVVVNDIVHIFFKQRVGFEQLVDRMHALRLDAVVGHYVVLTLLFLLGGQGGVVLHLGNLATHIGQDEELRVLGGTRQGINTLVGQFDSLVFLVDDEIEFVGGDVHVLLVLLHIELFGLLQAHLDTRLAQILDQGFVFRHTLERTEQCQLARLALFLVRTAHLGFCLAEQFGGQRGLCAHKLLHTVLVLVEHLVLALGHRTADNQRRTCVVNQDGVHLINDGEVMSALHKVERRGSHIVTQIVETELVVGTERDVAVVSTAAFVAVGFVLVDTINGQAMEHIDRSVPFRVTLCQIVVHRNHMHALVGQRIEENGQRGNKRLPLTRSHLGDLTLMEYNTADELHVIVHHIPCNLVAAGSPVVVIDGLVAVYLHEVEARVSSEVLVLLGSRNNHGLVLRKAVRSRFDDGKRLGKHLVENGLVVGLNLLFETIYLVIYFLALLYLERLDTCFQIFDFLFLVCYTRLNLVHQGLAAGTQFIVGEGVNLGVCRLDLLHIRHYGTHIFLCLIAE